MLPTHLNYPVALYKADSLTVVAILQMRKLRHQNVKQIHTRELEMPSEPTLSFKKVPGSRQMFNHQELSFLFYWMCENSESNVPPHAQTECPKMEPQYD